MNFLHRKLIALVLFAALALAIPSQLFAQATTKHHHYKLIDPGTFGGPQSFVQEVALVENNAGAAVGNADTSIPDPNYPNSCLFCSDPFIQHAFQWSGGVPIDLGALPGVNSSFSNWISGNGLVAGYSENGLIDPLLGVPELHGVLWQNGHILDLGTLEGGYESVALAVNSHGQVAGVSANLVPDPFGPLGTQNRTFLWQNGVMQDLGTLGGPSAGLLSFEGAVEINEVGQVVACSYTNSTPNAVTGTPNLDPFLWERGTMFDLGSLGGTSGCATFLNNGGQVVGYSNLAGDLTFHPFLWERGRLRDLGTLGGPTGIALWINELGEVVGNADLPSPPGCTSSNCVFHGFLWKDGVMTDIGTLAGTDNSTAASINSKTQIVGASFPSDFSFFNAILWENSSLVDLNTLIPPNSALHLFKGVDVNERGEIAGFGGLPNGDTHAFLLIPCDENHPNVEGCDYSLVEAGAAVSQSNPAVRGVPTALPASLLHRMTRYHLSGRAFGPRN